MAELLKSTPQTFFSPNKIQFGPGAVDGVGGEVKTLGGKKVLIVTDPGVVKADLLNPVTKSLESQNIPYSVFAKVEPEPPALAVDEGAKQLKAEGCDCVIGVGGGSSLDVAKGVSLLGGNEGSILDYTGFDLVKKPGVPKILIPTTAGTGSEVTRVLVITDQNNNTKKAVYTIHCLADVALVDPLMTATMPPHVTADSGVDALVHAVETYVARSATAFSDVLAERAIQLIGQYLPMAWAKGSNMEARYHMSLGSLIAGMAFASGGLGACHALAYPLGTEYHMPHGRSNAVMLPHIMKYNLCGNPQKFARIAELLGQDILGLHVREAANLAVEAVKDLLDTIQLSYRLRDYSIPHDDLPKLVRGGMAQTRLFVPNPRDLTEDDIAGIYDEAY